MLLACLAPNDLCVPEDASTRACPRCYNSYWVSPKRTNPIHFNVSSWRTCFRTRNPCSPVRPKLQGASNSCSLPATHCRRSLLLPLLLLLSPSALSRSILTTFIAQPPSPLGRCTFTSQACVGVLGHKFPPACSRGALSRIASTQLFACAKGSLALSTWAIPLLSGARLPDPVADPERFALLALLLLKPWSDATLCDLLAPTVPGPRLTHWSRRPPCL